MADEKLAELEEQAEELQKAAAEQVGEGGAQIVVGRRWVILITIFLGCVLGGFGQFVGAVFGPQIMEYMGITPSQFGGAMMAPMLSGIVISFFVGGFTDKYGIRPVLIVFGIVSVLGAILRIFSYESYGLFYLSFLLFGFFAAALSSSAAKIISEWFPKSEMGLAMGVFLAGGGTGNALTNMFGGYLFKSFQDAFFFSIILTAIVVVVVVILIKDRPDGAVQPRKAEDVNIGKALGEVLKNKYVWFIFIAMLFFMACNMTVCTYGPTAFQAKGLDIGPAGAVASWFSWGVVAGSILGATAILAIGRGKFHIPAFLFGIICCACILAGYFLVQPGAITSVLFFIAGFCVAAIPPTLTAALVFVPGMRADLMGTAGGFTNAGRFVAAVVIPSYIFAPLFVENWHQYFIAAAVSGLICALFCLLIPEVLQKDEK